MNNKEELTALEALEKFKLLYENKCKSPNNIIGFDVCYATIKQDLERLEKLKDLEQELGIDLITLFKALKEGIFVDNNTKWYPHCRLVYTYVLDKKWLFDCETNIYYLEDYNKSWNLPRKELEDVKD